MYKYEYPRPCITADLVVITSAWSQNKQAKVLLVERSKDPFKGKWALPGGFINLDEWSKDAAIRELYEETGLQFHPNEVKFVDIFEKPDRDPRGRVISFAYSVFVAQEITPRAGDDATKAEWHPVNTIEKLAFDHDDILKAALYIYGFSPSGEYPWPQ